MHKITIILYPDDTINFIHKNNLSFKDGLINLTNYEINHKKEAMTSAMVKVGTFPHLKELKYFALVFRKPSMKIKYMILRLTGPFIKTEISSFSEVVVLGRHTW